MRRVAKVTSLLAATMLGVAALPQAARAQSHANLVWTQLSANFDSASARGYSSLGYVISRMGDSETYSWELSVTSGMTYAIYGACDSDCSDLDLDLLDGTTSVDSDYLEDDFPVVTFTATKSGMFTIKVIMAACGSEPCYFGIGIFQK